MCVDASATWAPQLPIWDKCYTMPTSASVKLNAESEYVKALVCVKVVLHVSDGVVLVSCVCGKRRSK